MPKQNVWLIGGTNESVEIARILTSHSIPVVVTVTTLKAKNLYSFNPSLPVIVGKIAITDIPEFIQDNQIKIIVDASHPHAVNISSALIAISEKYHYPYLRYERGEIKSNTPNIIYVSSLSSLINSDFFQQKRVLLTIGSNNLHFFKDYQKQATLFTRILPYPESLFKAIQAGFTNDRIIAFRPPLSYELEKALWQLWQIETVVTKASGKQGGENLKHQLAQDLNIKLIVIKRPQLDYPLITENLSLVLNFCSQFFPSAKTPDFSDLHQLSNT